MERITFKGQSYWIDPSQTARTDVVYSARAIKEPNVRDWLEWGTYGKLGQDPLKYVLLKNMSDDHIRACLRTQPPVYLGKFYTKAFKNELKLRKNHIELSVKETF